MLLSNNPVYETTPMAFFFRRDLESVLADCQATAGHKNSPASDKSQPHYRLNNLIFRFYQDKNLDIVMAESVLNK